jgi:hypothetical protein
MKWCGGPHTAFSQATAIHGTFATLVVGRFDLGH